MGMFDCLLDIGNYDDRVVGRFDDERSGLMVSTARVSDGRQPLETAVKHPEYNDDKMVIVEAYDDLESAIKGHDKWVVLMTAGPLPEQLTDCLYCEFAAALLDPEDEIFPRTSPPAA